MHYFDAAGHWPMAPVMLGWGGNLCVCIFFALSGYVLVPMTLHSTSTLISQLIRRLVRLGIPVFGAILFAYLLWRFGLMTNQAVAPLSGSQGWLGLFYDGTPSFIHALRETIVMPFVPVESKFDPVLWTMHVEYVGSFGVLALYTLIKSRCWRLSLALLIFALTYGTYYCDFAAGALLADLDIRERAKGFTPIQHRLVTTLLLMLFIIFGAYSWSGGPDQPWHWLDSFVNLFVGDYTQAHMLAAIFLLPVLLISVTAKNMFSSKPILELGRQSFSIYLLHLPLVCSLGGFVFLWAAPRTNYLIAFLATAAVIYVTTYLLAMAFTRYVDGARHQTVPSGCQGDRCKIAGNHNPIISLLIHGTASDLVRAVKNLPRFLPDPTLSGLQPRPADRTASTAEIDRQAYPLPDCGA